MEEEKSLRGRTLRRRLSVEQSDESKSPSAPSTPTKKRGRLATKPLLDNIDENAVVSSPKRATRKSIVSESNDERPLTPARRATRNKSNTSITAEITQGIESPRAMRAARRNSFAGSDTETPVTPVRATRRTRKDSSSSVENIGDAVVKLNTLGVVDEETNNSLQEIPTVNNQNIATPNKKIETNNIHTQLNSENDNTSITTSLSSKNDMLYNKNIKVSLDTSNNHSDLLSENLNKSLVTNELELLSSQEIEKQKLNRSLNISPIPTRVSPRLLARRSRENSSDIKIDSNKPTSNEKNSIGKQSTENIHKNTNNVTPNKIKMGVNKNSGDVNILKDNLSPDEIKDTENKSNEVVVKNVVVLDSLEPLKVNNSQTDVSSKDVLLKEPENNSTVETQNNADLSNRGDHLHKESENFSKKIFNMSGELKSAIYLEDSDSNTEPNILNNINSLVEDQCVPIVVQPELPVINPTLEISSKIDDNSCEPMDVDETLPENISIKNVDDDSNNKIRLSNSFEKDKENRHGTNIQQENSYEVLQNPGSNRRKLSLSSLNSLKKTDGDILQKDRKLSLSNSIVLLDNQTHKSRKDSQNSPVVMNVTGTKISQNKSTSLSGDDSIINIPNVKKNRKSSLSNSSIQDKSSNQNKSTLILSQIKDSSSNDVNTTCTDSPKTLDVKNKSVNKSNNNTPLKHKNLQQIGIKTSTPNFENTKIVKTSDENELKAKDQESSDEATSANEESSDEETKSANNLFYDEAEEANDSYKSGDSQDEEERKYEKENEITEKGETLTSEEEFSDDSEYEKDSFIVSSCEEDEDMLTGSGDDLSMSDNELKMTAKSKRKYDERIDKERKRASKEMYEARHNIKKSSEKSEGKRKSNRLRLESTADSSLDKSMNKSVKNIGQKLDSDSSDEEVKKPKIKNRLKLDSTSEMTVVDEKTPNNSLLLSKSEQNAIGTPDSESSKNSKRNKKTSKSMCDDEKEMTILEENYSNDKDPLHNSVLIKSEPETPQKGIDVSYIPEDIEEMEVDENVSMANPNTTDKVDPLEEDEQKIDDTDSDDEEIKNNYDSVLNNLNNLQKNKKTNTADISLNLDKKVKTKNKKPTIIDELNLTQVKANKRIEKGNTIQMENSDESSSSSLDLEDFFSKYTDTDEDKDEPQTNTKKDNISFTNIDKEVKKKKISSQNDSLQNVGTTSTDKDVSYVNESLSNKTKKEKNTDFENCNTTETTDILDNSTTQSKKKNNIKQPKDIDRKEGKSNRKQSITKLENSILDAVESVNLNNSESKRRQSISKQEAIDLILKASTLDEPVLHSPNESMTKKKKKKSISVQDAEESITKPCNIDELMSISLNESRTKKKKKHSMSEEVTEESVSELNNTYISEVSMSKSLNESSIKKKKKKHSMSEDVQEPSNIDISENPMSISLNESTRKKKHSLSEQVTEECVPEPNNTEIPLSKSLNESATKKKKKHSISEQVTEESVAEPINTVNPMSISLNESTTKKKKRKNSMPEQSPEQCVSETNNTVLNSSQSRSSIVDNKITKGILSKNKENLVDESQQLQESCIVQNESVSKRQKKKVAKAISSQNQGLDLLVQSKIDSVPEKKNKKRKRIEEDSTQNKAFKEHLHDNIKIRRLPQEILDQLSHPIASKEKHRKITSTTEFNVEQIRTKRSRPSEYLEESIHVESLYEKPKRELKIKRPKILPTVPTASISSFGFTTNFQINVLHNSKNPFTITSDSKNFRQESLYGSRIRRMNAYDKCKKLRNIKLSKF